MYVLGLTGSIAMGKSTVLEMFQDLDVPVFDTDQEIRNLFVESAHLRSALKASFPDALDGDFINRARLADLAFADEESLRLLESIVHPIIMIRMGRYLERKKKQDVPLIVYDIPLLFEVSGEDVCDGVVVVSSPAEVQKERALARPGMTEDRLKVILGRQMPDEEKRKRADFIIHTGTDVEQTRKEVALLVKRLKTDG